MARSGPGGFGWRPVLGIAFFSCLTFAAGAEETPSPIPLPPLSPQCEVPAVDIAAPAPLANVAAVLQAGNKVRILAIGSSSTAGIGVSSGGKTYPAQLEFILEHALKGVDVEVLNRGVPGEVAAVTADRIKSEVALEKPDLVLWQLGTNDALSRVAPEDFESTVRGLVDWLKENKIDVALVGMQYTSRFAKDQNYSAINEVLQKIAAEENILYVRRYDAMQFIAKTRSNLQLMAGDNFHLNELGYHCMAEHIARAVIVNLYVKKFRPIAN